MSNETVISIIVPVYNAEAFLDECLNSIYLQEFKKWECIIVNDGSVDNSNRVALNWVNFDNRFSFYEIQNSGPSFARNYAVSKSKGIYILPIDSDDFISKNYCSSCLDLITINDNNKVVYGAVQNFGINNDFQLNEGVFNLKTQLISNQIHVSGLFRKSDFLAIDGYDIKMRSGYEDWEFYIRLMSSGGECIQSKDCILFYRRQINSHNQRLVSNDKKIIEVENYIFAKNNLIYGENGFSCLSIIREYNKSLCPEVFYSYRFIYLLMLKKIKRTFTNLYKRKNN